MGRVKVDVRTAGKESYNKFCKENPSIKIDFKTWVKISEVWGKLFFEEMMETGLKLKLPYGFGALAVNKKKIKNFYVDKETGKQYSILPVDWTGHKPGDKLTYNFNYHSDGYRCNWLWFNYEALIFEADIWQFFAHRNHKRRLAYHLIHLNAIDRYSQWSRRP